MWYIILGVGLCILMIMFYFLQSLKRSGHSMFNFIFLTIGLLAGVAIAYVLFKGKWGFGKSDVTDISSHTIVQRIERVFKVVTAEGHFSEIYDYSNTSHILSVIPSTKKALVVVNAKVMMGFDFKKMKWEVDEQRKSITILEFPQPEILSIEPDMKYYNLENGLFNKFNNEDLTKLQLEAKAKITEAVLKSDLPTTANKQMQAILVEMIDIGQWHLNGQEKINGSKQLLIETEKK